MYNISVYIGRVGFFFACHIDYAWYPGNRALSPKRLKQIKNTPSICKHCDKLT